MTRRWQILKGHWATTVLDMFAFLVQAIIMGTVFFRLKNETSTFFSRGGVLFLLVFSSSLFTRSLFADTPTCSAILFSALTTISEIPIVLY